MTVGKAVVLTIIAIFAACLIWQFGGKAQAQECPSVAEDRAIAEAMGFTWLGVKGVPFTPDSEVVFYWRNGVIFVSPIVNGCVSGSVAPVATGVPLPAETPPPVMEPQGVGI